MFNRINYAYNKCMNRKHLLIIILFVFMGISCMNLYSYDFLVFKKQIIWYLISFIVMMIVSKIKSKKLIKYIFYLYIIFNVLLLYLLFFGNVVNGSKAWLNIGFISFQPSEFMKIILIILLSYIGTIYDKYIFKSIIIVLIPSILTFLEPDTGNVIFYIMLLMSLFMYKNNTKIFIYSGLLMVVVVGFIFISYYFFDELFIKLFGTSFFYRIDRVVNLFNNETYQLNMGLTGIVSSLMLPNSVNVIIPEAHTDFIFSYLIMNSGLICLIIYLVVNLIFNYLLIYFIKRSIGVNRVVIFMFLMMKLVQEGIHIFMNIGLFPITGITLPFISYGGSSLLSYFILIGYIFSSCKDIEDMDKGMVLGYNKQV